MSAIDTLPAAAVASDASAGQVRADGRSPLIIADKVNKHFGHFHVIKEVSTNFYQGEVTVIVGASGSGKS
ncbi:hypothetical protein ACFOFO_18135, partial [Undibacterium arcticum]